MEVRARNYEASGAFVSYQRRMRALGWVVASVLWLTGCAVTTSIVREEAASDLDCPPDELDVRVENKVFHVAGCELQATYRCSRDGLTPSLCERIGQRGVPIARREPIVRAKASALLDCEPDALEVSKHDLPGRMLARGCGRRIVYECITRGDCCAFTTPGAQPDEDVAPPAPAPAEEQGKPKGSLSKAHIRAVIDAGIGDVRACYESPLGAPADRAGIVVVQFIIAPDGHVQVAALQSSSLGVPEVEQCVLATTKRFRFAKPKGGGIVVVTYPFALQLDPPRPTVECQ